MWDIYKSDNSIGPYAIVSHKHESPSHKDFIEDHFIPGYSLWPFLELESQPGVLLDGLFEVNLKVMEVIWLLVDKIFWQVSRIT